MSERGRGRACQDKQWYPDQITALLDLVLLREVSPMGQCPTRAYRCPINRPDLEGFGWPTHWHLTSQERDQDPVSSAA